MILPVRRMLERVDLARDDSDTTYFLHLLYAGEFITKLIVSGMLAALDDDRERHRYRLTHRLIRSDGLGDWATCLDEILVGPASQVMSPKASEDRRSISERMPVGCWQHDAIRSLSSVLSIVHAEHEAPGAKVALAKWFSSFATLRNKTRAHGATTPELCGRCAPALRESIDLVATNTPILKRRWAYLHRNLSGTCRVLSLREGDSPFEDLKRARNASTAKAQIQTDGLYVDLDEPRHIELVRTSVDLQDFYVPNGAFRNKTFEWLSLLTDSRASGDATPYLSPPGERPPSETEGLAELIPTGRAFTNLPGRPKGYVARIDLERTLIDALRNDRHPVVTLVGRGGIGKTSVALSALHQLAMEGSFENIVWLSARDIDLGYPGPKVVRPKVLSPADIAKEYVSLVLPAEASEKGFKPTQFFETQLRQSQVGSTLFVFDNFETVRDPGDVFRWLDMHIRLPNKILITTRHREFKADFPIEVGGMTPQEADQLIDSLADQFGVRKLLTSDYRHGILEESDGHPYVIKVLIGDVARAQRLVKIERLVASHEDILDALFERTYAGLTPGARRVFLTLCGWRSFVPQIALEAILLRPENEKMDVAAAVEELVQSSFIDRTMAPDETSFLSVTLVAQLFGLRKLELSAMRNAVHADIDFLNQIGSVSLSGVRHGAMPQIERLFGSIARRVAGSGAVLAEFVPSLEYIARQRPVAWLLLANLFEESAPADGKQRAIECVRRYLEVTPDRASQGEAWGYLERLQREIGDWSGAVQTVVMSVGDDSATLDELSSAANRVNSLLREQAGEIESDEKRALVGQLARALEIRIGGGDATDRSRLAWLYLHLRQDERASEHVEAGLRLDPRNDHCARLRNRLEEGRASRRSR